MSTCGRCGAPTPAGARFCPACGAAVAEVPATSQALKTVTVVFTDLVDSVPLGERFDPESLNAVMREYFDAASGVVARYGGSVEKFIGDAVVAVFGIPALHEDDALRAVSAAAAIHRRIAELSTRLQEDAGVTLEIRTGVNTGEVLSQMEGGPAGRLVGDSVNLAARLQQTAAPGEILLGPETRELVKDRVRTEVVEPFVAKGRTAPVRAHRLLEVLPAERSRARPRAPIVGRGSELRLLRETLQRVVEDRSPHLFMVLGAPGIGKSRLVAELEDDEAATILRGRCLPYGEGITYWPIAEIVQKCAGIKSGDAPETARAKLIASAGDGEEAVAVADRVAQVVGLSDSGGTTDELFWAVRKYLEHLAEERPLVVVFDDLHWAEPTMLDLVEHVLDSVAEVPLLLLCMARPELLEVRPLWGGGKPNVSSLDLGPLKDPDCRVLVGSLLGESPSLDEVIEAVLRVADGNPLFVEEMVSMLVDDGVLDRSEGQWTATRELASLSVPPTIQALVSARLDRLPREEREVVDVAAVMGKVFAPDAVGELVGGRVDYALDGLTRKQLVAPEGADFAGGRLYSFRHLLIRDTAYEHLPRMTRASIHERFADWLVRVLGDRIAEYDEIVGYHLEQAHRYQSQLGALGGGRTDLATRAAERLAEGGRRALARQDATAAVKLLSRAAELLSDKEARLEVLPELGLALYEAADYSRAISTLESAIVLGESLGDRMTATRCRIFRELARFHHDPQMNAEESRSIAEAAMGVLEDCGDDYGLYYAWNIVAYAHDSAGRSEEALAALRKAAHHADRSGVATLIARQKRTLLRSLAWGPGTTDEIIPLAEDLLEWARTRHDRYSQARALLTLAHAHAMTGDFNKARSYARAQEQLCDDVSLEFLNAWGAFEKAQVELLAGNLEAAEAEVRAGCEFLSRKGETAILPTLQAQHADILYMSGLLSEAKVAAEAARSGSAADDLLTETKWRSVLAKVLVREGEVGEALRLAEEAVKLGHDTGFVDWHAGVLVDVGEVLDHVGRVEDSRAAYEEAARLFARKGNATAERRVAHALRQVS